MYGRPPIHPIEIALNFDGFEEVTNVTQYALTVREWPEVARKIARKEVNQTHDTHVPRFNAKRSTLPLSETNDLVLEWRTISGEELTIKPFWKWIGQLKVTEQTRSVSYRVQPIRGKRKPYIVHVESFRKFNARTEFPVFELPDSELLLIKNQEVKFGILESTAISSSISPTPHRARFQIPK